jgi:hypothetical protein
MERTCGSSEISLSLMVRLGGHTSSREIQFSVYFFQRITISTECLDQVQAQAPKPAACLTTPRCSLQPRGLFIVVDVSCKNQTDANLRKIGGCTEKPHSETGVYSPPLCSDGLGSDFAKEDGLRLTKTDKIDGRRPEKVFFLVIQPKKRPL